MSDQRLQVVVETPEFIRQAKSCMDDDAKNSFIEFIAKSPLVGDLMSGTGGARKVRWMNRQGRGKRGGARIIYYYHNQTIPIFLFTVYGKNQKANLTKAEQNALRGIIESIVENYEDE